MQNNFNSFEAKATCTYLTNIAVLESFLRFYYEGMYLKIKNGPIFSG